MSERMNERTNEDMSRGTALPYAPTGAQAGAWMRAWAVFHKELRDALRDRRTLLVVLLSTVAMGPLVLALLTYLVKDTERRAEAREIVVHGIEHAPSLSNFIARQTYKPKQAPAQYEEQLRNGSLQAPVLVVPPEFERQLQAGEAPTLWVVYASNNRHSMSGLGAVQSVAALFNQEHAQLRLAWRGVAQSLTEAIQVEQRDLATSKPEAQALAGMIPFMVLMAVLYGALTAALDTTSGERERSSLEPLLMTPAPRWTLVLGKWGAVAAVAMLIAALSCLSLWAAPALLRSDALAAMFRYGLLQAGQFMALLLPLAAALSAMLMAVAIRCKSVKEAQANVSLVFMVVSFLPLVSMLNSGAEAPWHLLVPVLAQSTLMGRVLKGEAVGVGDAIMPLWACIALTVVSLCFVSWRLRRAASAG